MWLLESRRELFRVILGEVLSFAVIRCLRTGMLRYPDLLLLGVLSTPIDLPCEDSSFGSKPVFFLFIIFLLGRVFGGVFIFQCGSQKGEEGHKRRSCGGRGRLPLPPSRNKKKPPPSCGSSPPDLSQYVVFWFSVDALVAAATN